MRPVLWREWTRSVAALEEAGCAVQNHDFVHFDWPEAFYARMLFFFHLLNLKFGITVVIEVGALSLTA